MLSRPYALILQRNATAGAPKGNDDYVRDEDFDTPSPPPNPNSQQASAAMQTMPGVHGGGRLCCLE
jgi:hypothetical protein